MAKSKEPTNPFYLLLVVVGVIFAITACAYGVMAFRAVASKAVAASASGEALMQFLDQYGLWVLLGELALLALATFAAIGSDDYWIKRAKLRESTGDHEPTKP